MIKFRAWDKKTKEYFHISELWNSGTNPECFNFDGWTDNFGDKGRLKDIVIEQFTGLKDVNGKDIYEGDIIRILSINAVSDVEYMRDGSTPEFETDRRAVLTGENVLGEAAPNDIEVIGNVHSNPELLEV